MHTDLAFDEFLARYVSTNVPPGAPCYDKSALLQLSPTITSSQSDPPGSSLGFFLLVAQCCAMKRGDLVPRLFRDMFGCEGETGVLIRAFSRVRETLNIIWPFVGVPQIVPACLGLVGSLESLDDARTEELAVRRRGSFCHADTLLGGEIRATIYKASANSEVFQMLSAFFPDFAYALDTVGFGFNMGKIDGNVFTLAEAELILTASLVGLGAIRQAGSHIKACVSFGWTEEQISLLVDSAKRLREWTGKKAAPDIDVVKLAKEARTELARQV